MGFRFRYLILAAVCMAGCSTNAASFVSAVDSNSWKERLEFDYVNDDTVSLRNMDLFFRCGTSFHSSAIPVRITYAIPDGRLFREEFTAFVNVPIQRSRVADVVVVPYRHTSRFSVPGHYVIAIEPMDTVSGLEAVGFRIENE